MPQTQEEHLIALEDEKEDSDSEHGMPTGPDVEVINVFLLFFFLIMWDLTNYVLVVGISRRLRFMKIFDIDFLCLVWTLSMSNKINEK